LDSGADCPDAGGTLVAARSRPDAVRARNRTVDRGDVGDVEAIGAVLPEPLLVTARTRRDHRSLRGVTTSPKCGVPFTCVAVALGSIFGIMAAKNMDRGDDHAEIHAP
jgi:hypothetical protein